MAPVRDEVKEKDENVPKMLCQMDNHLGRPWYEVKKRYLEIEHKFYVVTHNLMNNNACSLCELRSMVKQWSLSCICGG